MRDSLRSAAKMSLGEPVTQCPKDRSLEECPSHRATAHFSMEVIHLLRAAFCVPSPRPPRPPAPEKAIQWTPRPKPM
jgi:hypothetical protein